MIIVAFFITILILLMGLIMFKALKDKEEFDKQNSNKKAQKSKQPIKTTEIMNENKFEVLLAEARKDPEKLEILKRRIQDTLRSSVKEKNISGARTCNMQLKRIDTVDRKETQD